jgi:hypothetical protein
LGNGGEYYDMNGQTKRRLHTLHGWLALEKIWSTTGMVSILGSSFFTEKLEPRIQFFEEKLKPRNDE